MSPPKIFTLKLTMMAPTKTEKNKKIKSDESKIRGRFTADENAINHAHEEGSPQIPISQLVGGLVRPWDENVGEFVAH